MPIYEYGRIGKLADSLAQNGVPQDVADRIMAGGDLVKKGDKPEKKAEWLSSAMDRMDSLLDEKTRCIVREDCACCLGGRRLELSRKIARENPNLEDAIRASNETPYVFGHSVNRQRDGSILVSFEEDGKDSYRCVCLPKAKAAVSITYCYCCGGHIKHHLQIALNRKLSCTAADTALASGGKSPCKFAFTVLE